jgi:hypothetical protein
VCGAFAGFYVFRVSPAPPLRALAHGLAIILGAVALAYALFWLGGILSTSR